jgi:hypothetical protein
MVFASCICIFPWITAFNPLDLNILLCKQCLKNFIKRLTALPSLSKLEQKAQVDLVMVWVESMLGKNSVIRRQYCGEGLDVNVGGLLRIANDCVQDFNV